MKTLDMTTTLVLTVPTAIVTSLVLSQLGDDLSLLVSWAIAGAAGIFSGLVALGLYKLVRKS